MIVKGAALNERRSLIAGFLVLILTVLAAVISIFYNVANATTSSQVLLDSAIIFFLVSLDEMYYAFIARISPSWLENIEKRIFSRIEINERQDEELLGDRPISEQGDMEINKSTSEQRDIEINNSGQTPKQENLPQSIPQEGNIEPQVKEQEIYIKELKKLMEEQESRMEAIMKQQKEEHDAKIKELVEEVKFLKSGQIIV